MPGSTTFTAHIAEVIRKRKEVEAAASKANAKSATQKASSQGVSAIVNQGIKSAGGGRGSTLSSIKKPSGGVAATASQYSPFSNADNNILAQRIARRKAIAQRNQGRYSVTHDVGKKKEDTKQTPGKIMQQHNKKQVEEFGTAKDFVDNIGLMGESVVHGAGKGTLNAYIEGSHFLDALYKRWGGDEAASGNIHKKVIAANKRSNEANNVGNPLDDFQKKYQRETAEILEKAEKYGLDKTAGFMMGLGQSAAALPAFAIPGLGEASLFFQLAGQRYDEAKAEGASEDKALLSSALYAFPSAVIERFGGGERVLSLLLKGLAPKRILYNIAQSAVTEGVEEGMQQVVESGSKSVYQHVPLYSNKEDIDAWINPKMIKDSFVQGALAGGILGGAVTGVKVGLDAAFSKGSSEPLDLMDRDVRKQLGIGQLDRQTAETMLNDIAKAKAVFDVSQSSTVFEAQGKIDGYVNDSIFTEEQGAEAKKSIFVELTEDKNKDIPTSTDEIALDTKTETGETTSEPLPDPLSKINQEQIDQVEQAEQAEQDVADESGADVDQRTKLDTSKTVIEEQEQAPERAEAKETVAPDAEVETAWNELKDQYGTWQRGQAPQQIDDVNIVSKFVDNFLANIEDPAIRDELKRRVMAGEMTHERYTDKQAQADLAKDRAILGEDAVNAQIRETMETLKSFSAKKAVTGQIEALVDATNNGDAESALLLAQSLAEAGTNLGQGTQAFSQLKKLTPAGRLLYAQQQLNADYNKKHGYAPEAVKADIEQEVAAGVDGIINDALESLASKESDISPIAKYVSEYLKSNNISFASEAKKGNLKELVLDLTRYAAEGQNLDADAVVDVYGALWGEVEGRLKKYRDGLIKSMIGKSGKNKRRTFLKRLIEYNNIGAFDNPDTAALILNQSDLPFLTPDEVAVIVEAAEKASQLPEGSREQLMELGKINKLIESKKRYTVGEKIRTVQITMMLGNMRTMERNVVPNLAMVAPNTIGNVFGTVLDKQIAKKTGQRTTGLPSNPWVALKDAGGGLKNVYRDTRDGIDTSLAGNRDKVPMVEMFSNKNPFGWTVNKGLKAMTIGLQSGDRPFEEAYYNNSLRRQVQLNNVSEPTQLMKDIARQIAIERTWKDENQVTKFFEGIKNGLNFGQSFGIGSLVFPFLLTPANLMKATYSYSPLAAASVIYDYSQLKKADPGTEEQVIAQFNLVNHFSKAAGGTFIMALAFALAKAGLIEITGGGDDNDEREKYNEEVLGWQPYSIRIGNKWHSYAWMQPFSFQFGVGVDLYEAMNNADTEDGYFPGVVGAIGEAMFSAQKMIYDETVMQGIANLFGGDDLTTSLLETAANAPQQFIPSLLRQFAAAIDPYKRQTYVPGGTLDTIVQSGINGFIGGIPFASKTLPAKVNSMGETMERYPGGTATDALNAFLYPAPVRQIREDPLTDEIARLEKATNSKLYPSGAKNSVDVGEKTVKLTGEEKNAWNASVGGDFKKAVETLMASPAYREMSDEQKAKTISKIHEDLNAIYKHDLLSKKGYEVELDTAYKKVKKAAEKGISLPDFVTVGTSLNLIDNDGEGDYSIRKRQYILDYGFDDEKTIFMLKTHNLISDTAIANAEELEEMHSIDTTTFYKAWIETQRIESEYSNNRDTRVVKQREYIAGLEGLTAAQKTKLDDKLVNDDIYIPNDKEINYEDGLDSAIISALSDTAQAAYYSGSKYVSTPISKMGLSAAEFSWAYAYMNKTDGNKKADYAAKLDELNLPATTKSAILAARGYKPNYSFSSGGKVEVGSRGEEPAVSTAKVFNDTFTVSSKRNPVEVQKSVYSPLAGDFTVSSPYGPRKAPLPGASTFHQAVDLSAPEGTPVIAIKNGTVTRVSSTGGYGISVEVTFDDGSFAKYSHLKSRSVSNGDVVQGGVQIGEVGSTGLSKGAHLDFKYKADKDGDWVDPAQYFSFAGNDYDVSGNYVASKSADGGSSSSSSSSGNGRSGGAFGHVKSNVIASSIGNRRGSYSRYGYGGWPRYSYTGNENKTKS